MSIHYLSSGSPNPEQSAGLVLFCVGTAMLSNPGMIIGIYHTHNQTKMTIGMVDQTGVHHRESGLSSGIHVDLSYQY